MPFQTVIHKLQECLEYETEEQSDLVECSRETLQRARELARTPSVRASAAAAAPAAALAAADVETALHAVTRAVRACRKCPLHDTRIQAVPGQGSLAPEILFVGEAPGADEDKQGLAFVGRAGQLLTRMIEAMGYTRDEVFIANILKCRPPQNRPPLPEEMQTCLPYLREQVRRLSPKAIVTLGSTAVKGLLPDLDFLSMGKTRGRWLAYEGIDVMPTYHPAYLLRNPSAKVQVWQDLQAVLARLGKKPPRGTNRAARDA